MRVLCVALAMTLTVIGAASSGEAPYADGVYVPPVKMPAELSPIPADVLDGYLDRLQTTHTFAVLEGMNETLKDAFDDSKALAVARGYPVEMDSEALFPDSFAQAPYTVYEAAIVSIDALALRLLVDLSRLEEGDEVWVVDILGPRAFGPYTRDDAIDGGRWLATTEGSCAVLIARTTSARMPQIALLGVSHFFRALPAAKSAEPCQNNIACEEDATIQNASTAVGLLVYSDGLLTYTCSCTLLNNADTPEFEPYVLTAGHCLSTGDAVDTAEVFWDYRDPECGTDNAPALHTLPRSDGDALLATDSALDITLFRVDAVPGGSYGRYYAGWDTRALDVDENVVGIHHPSTDHMRISYGRVLIPEVNPFPQRSQIQVLWDWYGEDSGFTERGSSGSALMATNSDYRVVGALSNGNMVDCSSPVSTRWDNYASLRHFYPEVADYLSGTNPPDPGPDPDPGAGCPAKAALADNPAVLENLRAFRDSALMPSPVGRVLVDAYYKAAPVLAEIVRRSPRAKHLFIAAAAPFAVVGEAFRQQNGAPGPAQATRQGPAVAQTCPSPGDNTPAQLIPRT